MLHAILVSFALLLVIEGVLPFLRPQAMRRLMIALLEADDHTLRLSGLTSMAIGVLLLYLFN